MKITITTDDGVVLDTLNKGEIFIHEDYEPGKHMLWTENILDCIDRCAVRETQQE